MPRPTIDDVATLAGVSIKTVSRVVNREPNVRESTREKVEKAIAELDYRPNTSAQNLASHRAHLIVLVYDDPAAYETPSSGYIIRMQQGALKACRDAGFELLIYPCNFRRQDVGRELQNLIYRVRPAGIIVAAPLSNMPAIVGAVKETGTPYVRLAHGTKNGKEYSVVTNDREYSADMTKYLASLGHERIAFIKGDVRHRAVGNRFDGYRDGLEEAGLPYREELVAQGDNSVGSGEECAAELLARSPRPTAIFCANDDMAAGVLRVATRLGIRVPDQLSIAGCDDIALTRQLYPSLTTIRQPLGAMAEAASLALIDDSRGKPREPQLEVIAGKIEIRESTAPPAEADGA
ncbi:MAG: LacI family DNA-binding transcriptional regulator [Woeseiaceae bacterium]|nr:LacI family DNA-binding transcriptional regulator [Gammaproteobacteria bacterium]NNK25528.1 LacI family DNA-binding transcriptional regulator [Woeseiaceae bacterium]